MSILIGGDLVPFGKVEKLFEAGEVEKILGPELLKIWNEADERIFNLECPITNCDKKIVKCGPNIKCTPESILGIEKLKPSCILLANNHILDYSAKGLKDTTYILDKNNIKWLGVGKNLSGVVKSFTIVDGDKTVAIYNCCEHEFSIASVDSCGANPYTDDTFDDIKNLKSDNDYVIVIYHGGKEHYRYPSPQLQKRCRKMVEVGADLIICQHSHCVGCEENYMNGTIVYGQGNFVFNMKQDEFCNNSLLLNVTTKDNLMVKYIPIVQTDDGTRLANTEESARILDGFRERSRQIKKTGFVYQEYQKFADSEFGNYILMLYGNHLFIKVLRRFFPGLSAKMFSKMNFNYEAVLNIVNCEAHNELFTAGLEEKIRRNSRRKNK